MITPLDFNKNILAFINRSDLSLEVKKKEIGAFANVCVVVNSYSFVSHFYCLQQLKVDEKASTNDLGQGFHDLVEDIEFFQLKIKGFIKRLDTKNIPVLTEQIKKMEAALKRMKKITNW